MTWHNKVLWTEGMFLQPQHFQQHERYLEKLIESEPNIAQAQEQDFAPEKWYSVPRARLMPTTFVVKACKPN